MSHKCTVYLQIQLNTILQSLDQVFAEKLKEIENTANEQLEYNNKVMSILKTVMKANIIMLKGGPYENFYSDRFGTTTTATTTTEVD